MESPADSSNHSVAALSIPLQVESLVKNYGQIRAVNEVTFELQEGEIFGLLGPNGAGKTSIISMIVSLEKATSGRVRVFGHDVAIDPRLSKPCIGLVPQELVNHGYFNIEEVLSFHSGYYGLFNNKKRERFLLERLGLWEHRLKKVKQLSGGMKRRLLIAKALVHSPPLLLLDEPTAGVDIELRENLWSFVQELKQEGITVLLTTHYLEEAERLCDRIGVIHQGKLQKIGKTSSLIAELTQRRVCLILRSRDSQREKKKYQHPYLIQQKEDRLDFQLPALMGIGELLQEIELDFNDLMDVKIREGNLEDAFRQIVGTQEQ